MLLSSLSLCVQAQSLEHELQQLVQSYAPMAQVGFVVMEAPTGKIITEYQSQKNFTPASNAKLLSSYAALKALGPKFQYTTQIYQRRNDWIVRFSGDPSLTTSNVSALLEQIKKQGITTLSGNLVVDDTLYSDEPYSQGWMHDDLSWAYAAPVTTLTLDENAVSFLLTPGKTIGEIAKLKINNPTSFPGVTLEDRVVSVTPEKAENHCHLTMNIDALHYKFGGCWAVSESPTILKAAIQNPRAHFSALMPTLLKKAGIDFKGKVIYKKSDVKDLKLLAEHRSQPLKELLKPILSDSNNQYANALFKTLGYQTLGEGTFQAGSLATKTFLKPTGIDTKQMKLQDGAGISYYNQISPHVFARLLQHIYHDPTIKTIFIDSLPISGQSGTLKYKLQAQNVNGRIKAKTGTMTGVTNLSGFLRTQSEKDITFSFMVNGAMGDRYILDQLIAEVCYLLVFHPETNRKS